MDMDHSTPSSSSSPHHHDDQNWLAFSLSNNNSHHFSLFQVPSLFNSGGVDRENGSSGGACTDHDLPLLGGPKLENFLGRSSSSSSTPHQFDGTNIGAHHNQGIMISNSTSTIPNVDPVYDDSELKTLAAAGFLHGGSSDKQLAVAPPAKKAAETFGQRTSIFRGVTRHRWTGRYEAHLWDNSCRREGQSRKGRQVYLGGYDKEEKAARAYDLAALKYWGPTTTTNFPVLDYEKEIEEMKHMTRQEFVASLRRKSSGFSRGASMYRGVTRHHQHGRWQARIGRVAGNKDLYLGTFSTQEEAAEAYDIAAIKFRGLNAVTNFDMSRYDVKSIATSNLPIGGTTNKSKTSSESQSENNKSIDAVQSSDDRKKDHISCATSTPFPSQNSAPTISFGLPIKQDQSPSLWAALGYQNPAITSTARNPNIGITLFQDSNTTPGTATLQVATTPYAMEFPCNANNGNNNNEGFFNSTNAGYYSPQQDNNATTSPSGTTTHNPSSFVDDENWAMSPPLYRPAKPSLSSFQTPIFGME